MAYSFSYFIK
ncbi:uncharacterized protein FFB20_14610 [Fusarium fujikuroi]|nr:uncharacterized protein FFB20_14610 [Fusarium fujikuroi]